MSLLNQVRERKNNRKPESVEVDGETYYFAKLSASQKDRFDLQYGSFRESNGNSNVGLRGFVVAFCVCDENGSLLHESGDGDLPSDEFLTVAKEYMETDADLIEPCFEVAGTVNKIIGGSEKN